MPKREGRPSARDTMDESVLIELRADRLRGMAWAELAEKYGKSQSTIKRWLSPDPLKEALEERAEATQIDLGADPETLLHRNVVIIGTQVQTAARVTSSPVELQRLASANKSLAVVTRTSPRVMLEDGDTIDAQVVSEDVSEETLRDALKRIVGRSRQ